MEWRRYRTIPWEVLAILLLSQMPYLLAEFMHRSLASEQEIAITSFWMGVVSRYSISDIFGYATGVLGSASVFFILRHKLLGKSLRMVLTGILFPVVVIALSALLPTVDAVSQRDPNSFVSGFALAVFVLLFVSWVVALFEQRNLESQDFDVEGHRAQADLQRAAREEIG